MLVDVEVEEEVVPLALEMADDAAAPPALRNAAALMLWDLCVEEEQEQQQRQQRHEQQRLDQQLERIEEELQGIDEEGEEGRRWVGQSIHHSRANNVYVCEPPFLLTLTRRVFRYQPSSPLSTPPLRGGGAS